jgi:hypothetical protein
MHHILLDISGKGGADGSLGGFLEIGGPISSR